MKAGVSALLMCLVGCTELGDDNIFTALPDAEPLLQPTFDSISQHLFPAHCSCHTLNPPAAGMSLRRDDAFDALVNAPVACAGSAVSERVVPGDPDSSFLYLKISAKNEPTLIDCMDPMPPEPSGPLSDRQLDVVRQWIEDGANP